MFSTAQLLKPISAASACGEDISFSGDVDLIVKARVQDDPTLDQGAWVVALREADWPFVAARCAALIESRSKDLRLAVWLAEAQAMTRKLRGLGDGYALLAGLCGQFWDGLHPQPDEDGFEQRVGNLFWLLARTPQLVKAMPVTEDGAVCMASFETARQRMNAASADGGSQGWGTSPAPAVASLSDLDAARRSNSAQFNDTLLADARYCLASLMELEHALDARLGANGPGFAGAREVLLNFIDFIEPLATPPALADDGAGARLAGTGEIAGTVSGTLHTRVQALAQLRLVADFFRRTEPHSPVAYLADKAADWGDLPLHLWLRAVLKEPSVAAQMDELLGTQSPNG
jgi:type VI secretion system protein ImpA